ncbi:Orf7. Involved in tetrahydromethanopterin-dependent formaldehyde oxidation [Methylocella tundrae]|uniref:Orf7. Involved in tetrahydromethanopterin-dependent formaldehyde oxidation n=1 Tax=Methylocella tundrae TaxID=227605 RepID=A0A8B6LZC5_METTU|nr:triphosphoribosyl-dephospho-CoA synthase [Methylocella tundrae]VTZ27754.1 Orf7. Involved in tetrahydromethanopterin-dependent formaldehyde oxidation [Methylocella tundrae]VTZ48137.1 Orf7. Involved in tetrahydromethanopterin-dependent formaldehyde oxidation [Methylocella tundrae]
MSEAEPNEIAKAFIASCRDEIEAPKPGNVHIFADGHGMTVDHFLRSAEVAAEPLCRPFSTIGDRILGAVEATALSVGLNTNLGIILLCAPLAAAADFKAASPAERAPGQGNQEDEFRQSLKKLLGGLTREDAQSAFDAIVRAAPAGLGQSGRHDVRAPAETTLLDAMKEAASRDRIAYQYASDFSDVFTIGANALAAAREKAWPAPWPVVAVYLSFLAGIFDSHITRKNGLDAALVVQNAAIDIRERFMAQTDPADSLGDLLDFDRRLKATGLNPGTSADLTVATLFADRLILS